MGFNIYICFAECGYLGHIFQTRAELWLQMFNQNGNPGPKLGLVYPSPPHKTMVSRCKICFLHEVSNYGFGQILFLSFMLRAEINLFNLG